MPLLLGEGPPIILSEKLLRNPLPMLCFFDVSWRDSERVFSGVLEPIFLSCTSYSGKSNLTISLVRGCASGGRSGRLSCSTLAREILLGLMTFGANSSYEDSVREAKRFGSALPRLDLYSPILYFCSNCFILSECRRNPEATRLIIQPILFNTDAAVSGELTLTRKKYVGTQMVAVTMPKGLNESLGGILVMPKTDVTNVRGRKKIDTSVSSLCSPKSARDTIV